MKKYTTKFPVAVMSKILGVSRSGYYKWLINKPLLNLRSRQLDEHIKEALSKSLMTYGSPRVAQHLGKYGISCSKTTVARSMQRLNLVARPKRKYVLTTDSNHDLRVADNLLDRKLQSSAAQYLLG
jgi:putative transposase